MTYTASPTADYENHDHAAEALDARMEATRERYLHIIETGFRHHSVLPYVNGSSGRIVWQSFTDTVADVILEDEIFDSLERILKTSDCPQVRGLMHQMERRWVNRWLEDVAQASD